MADPATWNAEETIKTVGMERILADLIEACKGNEDYILTLRYDLRQALEHYQRRHDDEET